MKIAMLDVHNNKYKGIFDVGGPIKKAYCEKHGYDFLVYKTDNSFIPEERQDNWGRVQGILYHLKEYDWIFYLDTDILIMNDTIKIEDYIDENYNLIAGPLPDEGHIMTSGMLIKNCRWSFEFFLDLYAQIEFIKNEYHSPPDKNHATGFPSKGGLYFEQSSFHYLYDHYEKYFSKIKLVPRAWFNSETTSYNHGDFLIHFPGQIHKARLMRSMLEHGHEKMLQKALPTNVAEEILDTQKKYHLIPKLKSRFIRPN